MAMIHFGKGWCIFVTLITSINDIMAYVAGVNFGRTPLIRLSPNKTLEGFVGGAILTCILTFILINTLLSRESYLCPTTHLTLAPFELQKCDPDPNFMAQDMQLPFSFFGFNSFRASPAQLYACLIGLAASFVTPFGGFLASGVKRAYGIKDFSNQLPGHGGFYDRLDCNVIASLFAYQLFKILYRDKFKLEDTASMIDSLETEEKRELLDWLEQQLVSEAGTGMDITDF